MWAHVRTFESAEGSLKGVEVGWAHLPRSVGEVDGNVHNGCQTVCVHGHWGQVTHFHQTEQLRQASRVRRQGRHDEVEEGPGWQM